MIEPIELNTHADHRPAKQDSKNPTNEEPGSLEFMPLEEETKGSLQTDYAGQATQKQDISDGKQSLVEKENDAESEEGNSKPRQTDSDLLQVCYFNHLELWTGITQYSWG